MKRAFLCLLCCLFCVGCGRAEPQSAPVTEEMRQGLSELQLYLNVWEEDKTYTVLFTRGQELCQLRYCSPEERNGLTLTANDSTVSLSYPGLTAGEIFLPEHSLFSFLQKLFTELDDPALYYLSTPEGYVVETASGKVLLHPASLSPTEISDNSGTFRLKTMGE